MMRKTGIKRPPRWYTARASVGVVDLEVGGVRRGDNHQRHASTCLLRGETSQSGRHARVSSHCIEDHVVLGVTAATSMRLVDARTSTSLPRSSRRRSPHPIGPPRTDGLGGLEHVGVCVPPGFSIPGEVTMISSWRRSPDIAAAVAAHLPQRVPSEEIRPGMSHVALREPANDLGVGGPANSPYSGPSTGMRPRPSSWRSTQESTGDRSMRS